MNVVMHKVNQYNCLENDLVAYKDIYFNECVELFTIGSFSD